MAVIWWDLTPSRVRSHNFTAPHASHDAHYLNLTKSTCEVGDDRRLRFELHQFFSILDTRFLALHSNAQQPARTSPCLSSANNTTDGNQATDPSLPHSRKNTLQAIISSQAQHHNGGGQTHNADAGSTLSVLQVLDFLQTKLQRFQRGLRDSDQMCT